MSRSTPTAGAAQACLVVVIGLAAVQPLRADAGRAADALGSPVATSGHTPAAVPDPWDAIAPDRDRVLRRRSAPQAAPPVGTGARAASSGWLRTAGSLAAVVGLIMLLAWGYRAVAGGSLSLAGRGRVAGLIDVVSRTAVSPRQVLVLVRVGPRMVLLGVGPERIETLDTIDDAELVSSLAGVAAGARPDSPSAEFRSALHAQETHYAALEAEQSAAAPANVDLNQRLAQTLRRIGQSARQLGAA